MLKNEKISQFIVCIPNECIFLLVSSQIADLWKPGWRCRSWVKNFPVIQRKSEMTTKNPFASNLSQHFVLSSPIRRGVGWGFEKKLTPNEVSLFKKEITIQINYWNPHKSLLNPNFPSLNLYYFTLHLPKFTEIFHHV